MIHSPSGDHRPKLHEILQPDGSKPWLRPAGAKAMEQALETKERVPVIWMHGLECTCCSESFIRSAHPLVKDVILSMISTRL